MWIVLSFPDAAFYIIMEYTSIPWNVWDLVSVTPLMINYATTLLIYSILAGQFREVCLYQCITQQANQYDRGRTS